MIKRNLFSLLLLLALSACGTVEGEPSDDVIDHSDNGPPSILAVSPETGSVVEEELAVVITFSEPMDQDAVEEAIEFPAGVAPSFSWSADGSEVTASGLVPYPEGGDPAQVEPGGFQVAVGAGAADVDGEALEGERALDYTLRFKRITQVFPFSQTLSGNCFAACAGTWTWLAAGERSSDTTTASRGFLTIPFDGLPDGVVIDAAVLHTEIEGIQDNPFGWGDLAIDDLVFGAIDAEAYGKRGTELGVLFAGSPAPAVGAAASLDVTAAFADDYAKRQVRQNRTQFRIRFPHDLQEDPAYVSHHSDGVWDLVQLLRPATDLTVTYLSE